MSLGQKGIGIASGHRQGQPREQRLAPVTGMSAWKGGHYVSATLQGSSDGGQSQQRDRVTDEQAIIVKVTGGAITPTVTGAGVFPDNAQVF